MKMFRLPKNSNQSPGKKVTVVSIPQINQECKFPHRKCNLMCMENYNYCQKHILEDKSAPYKPCPYIYTVSGKKCGKAAYRPDRKDTWFCSEHSRKAHLIRQKATIKHAPPMTPESLLASLSHYAPPASSKSGSGQKKEENETEESSSQPSIQTVNPFVDIDAVSVNARCSQILDYASESDSDVEPSMLDTVWRAQDHESSDAESVDSQAEDPLKHAGVYTAEEVTNIIKDKMIRLQSLYIDQFRRLHHLLKERRRKYLHSLKKEKETLCSIHDQDKSSPNEYKLYQKLKALNHYHRHFGQEAVLHKKSLERRTQATEGSAVRTSHKGKCAFTEGGVKCGAKTLPVTKYCKKHILEDNQQVLFRACGFKRDDHVCKEPTANVFENATCVYHITLPSQPHTMLDMKETENVKPEAESVSNSQEDTTPMDTKDEMCCPPGPKHIQNESRPETHSVKTDDVVSQSTERQQEPANELVEDETELIKEDIEMSEMDSINDIKVDADNKMEIDQVLILPTETTLKEENIKGDELVMVDMTDVGVVEEVLESEEKLEALEPDVKLGALESKDKLESLESEDKLEVLESENKLEVLEPEEKLEVLDSDGKLEVLESEDKLEVLESESKLEGLESQAKFDGDDRVQEDQTTDNNDNSG